MNHDSNHTNGSSTLLQLKPVRFEFTHSTATAVSVAGTFNDWNPTSQSMESPANGHWLKETHLAPGTYEYCLVVDGQWIPDPLAKSEVPNPFGGRNSILEVVILPASLPLADLVPLPKKIIAKPKQAPKPPTPVVQTTAGVWIDHRKAVIAIASDAGEKQLEILSGSEKQPRRVDAVATTTRYRQGVPSDHHHEQEFAGHLNQFYDKVIAAVRHAEFILLFGPGEAKGELKKRLERENLGIRIAAMESADKMTNRQIAAKVRYYVHR